ncbi:MAG: PEP-CTERM sorting domain-containing protein [Armatimonadetes bacterium]|nr:PEP-CTERM sorting domain-containing protein [Armatimonadota bacterium]
MKTLLCFVCLALAMQPALAVYPIVTASINQSQGAVTYIYTLANTSATAEVTNFFIYIPEAVVSMVTSLSGSTEGWEASIYGRAGVADSWHVGWRATTAEYRLQPGGSGSFTLVTEPGVATSYDYAPLNGSNWGWGYRDGTSKEDVGNTTLPVPIPEPTSLLALGLTASGLGGVMMRRRRRGG